MSVAAFVVPTAAGAGGTPVLEPGAGWSTDLSDGRIAVRSFGGATDGSTLRLSIRVCTYDLTLTALTDEDGSFEVATDNAAPGSTDVTEGSITVDGELRGDDIVGRVEVDVRTFDNAGDTGTCELDEEYTATPKRRARGYDRVTAVVDLDAGDLAASSDAVYATDGARRVLRFDAAGAQIWSVETPDVVLALAASDEAAWLVRPGAVDRLDAATGDTTATLPVEGTEGPTEAVVADDGSLWVANGALGTVVRISPDGQGLQSTAVIDGRPNELAAVGDDLIVGVLEPSSEGGPAIERLQRVEASGELGTQVVLDDVTELAVTENVLWVRGLTGPAVAYDMDSLEPIEQARRIRDVQAMAGAGVLLWTASGDDLLAFSSDGRRVARIHGLVSDEDLSLLAGSPTAVWVESAATLLRVV